MVRLTLLSFLTEPQKQEMPDAPPYLFGYGSIRSDIGIPPSGCKSIGFGHVSGELWKIQNWWGVWAGLKASDETPAPTVLGEVFEITPGSEETFWKAVDRREQTERRAYVRKPVEVKMKDGQVIQAEAYFAEKCDWLERIKSGDWSQVCRYRFCLQVPK